MLSGLSSLAVGTSVCDDGFGTCVDGHSWAVWNVEDLVWCNGCMGCQCHDHSKVSTMVFSSESRFHQCNIGADFTWRKGLTGRGADSWGRSTPAKQAALNFPKCTT